MSKVSHLNFSLNTHFFVKTVSTANPNSLCIIFIVVSPAILFGTSNYPMCHIFLILSKVNIFLFEPYLSIIPLSSCISSFTVALAMPSTTSYTSSQTPSVNDCHPNNTIKQHLPWSGNISTLLPRCCQPLPQLAAHCSPLAAQHWCWPLPLDAWSVIRL
jgi:hypothetical protein